MPKNRQILEAQEDRKKLYEVELSFMEVGGGITSSQNFESYLLPQTKVHFSCLYYQPGCVCVCLRVHLFFGAGPAQGVFFSGCWSIVVSGISGHPSDWVFPRSGLDPSFRDEKMRKCMKSWRALLECFVVKSAERRFAP